MSGFVAIVATDPNRALDTREIGALANAYESLRPGTRDETSNNIAALAKIDTRTADRQGIERDGASWAASSGIIRSTTPLISAEPGELDGQFGAVRYDGEARRVDVITDPLGQHSIYTADRDGRAYFSTSALALAKYLRAQPNPYALSVFLRTGFHFGAMTHWAGITRLEPATIVSYTGTNKTMSAYYVPIIDEAVARLNFAQTVDHCLEIVTQAYRARYATGARSWSDLTGGYDTRFANVALAAAAVDFHTNTVGGPADVDVQLAQTVAKRAGWDWTRFAVPADWNELLPRFIPSALAWGDAHLDVLQLAEVLYGHAEKSVIYPSLFVGLGHEHFRGHAWRQQLWGAGASKKVNVMALIDMRWLQPLDTRIFLDDPTEHIREDFRARIANWVAPYRDYPNTAQLDILHLRRMLGHAGAYRSAADSFIRTTMPFYSRAVFQAAFSSQPRHRDNHRLMRRMIERLNPAVAEVETTSGGPAQTLRIMNVHRFMPYYAQLARKAAAKFSHKFLGKAVFLPPARSSALMADARRSLIEQLGLRDGSMRSASLFREGRLRDLMRDAGSANFAQGALLGRIITVELAIRAIEDSVCNKKQ